MNEQSGSLAVCHCGFSIYTDTSWNSISLLPVAMGGNQEVK